MGSRLRRFLQWLVHGPAPPSVEPDPARVFPWGSNKPTTRQRFVVAVAAAVLGAAWLLYHDYRTPEWRTDFAMAWFGARTLLEGGNPYLLVGPGLEFQWSWPLLYPATALVAAIPFAPLTEFGASLAFVAVSAFLLTYGMTRRSWHLLPILASEPFAQSARAAQWSIILTAALFLPWLAAVVAVKPQTGAAVVASTTRSGLVAALVGGVALLAVSLLLLPSWPQYWWALLPQADHMSPRIAALDGFFLLLLLFRWRRPEAWMILALAILPQTVAAYSLLMLLTVAATFRQAAALAIVSSLGALADPWMISDAATKDDLFRVLARAELWTAYIPAMLLVLSRPNAGEPPGWLSAISGQRKRNSTARRGARLTAKSSSDCR